MKGGDGASISFVEEEFGKRGGREYVMKLRGKGK